MYCFSSCVILCNFPLWIIWSWLYFIYQYSYVYLLIYQYRPRLLKNGLKYRSSCCCCNNSFQTTPTLPQCIACGVWVYECYSYYFFSTIVVLIKFYDRIIMSVTSPLHPIRIELCILYSLWSFLSVWSWR